MWGGGGLSLSLIPVRTMAFSMEPADEKQSQCGGGRLKQRKARAPGPTIPKPTQLTSKHSGSELILNQHSGTASLPRAAARCECLAGMPVNPGQLFRKLGSVKHLNVASKEQQGGSLKWQSLKMCVCAGGALGSLLALTGGSNHNHKETDSYAALGGGVSIGTFLFSGTQRESAPPRFRHRVTVCPRATCQTS